MDNKNDILKELKSINKKLEDSNKKLDSIDMSSKHNLAFFLFLTTTIIFFTLLIKALPYILSYFKIRLGAYALWVYVIILVISMLIGGYLTIRTISKNTEKNKFTKKSD